MSTLIISHSLHQFGAKSPLETSDLLGISVNKLSSIPCEVIESLQVFIQALIPLGQIHELRMLDCHETRRNIISPESRLELIPSDLGISRHSGPMMTPPMPAGPCSWCDVYSVFSTSVKRSRWNFYSRVFNHSSACRGSLASLKIEAFVSRKSSKSLY